MSIWDKIIPHRYFLNRSLRTAADDLRVHIDTVQADYEAALAKCKSEIARAKSEKDKQYDLLKQDYIADLSQYNEFLVNLQSYVTEYAELYLKKQALLTAIDKTACEYDLVTENIDFLYQQIALLNEDINLLEHRRELLTSHGQIDDIVDLINVTGSALPCDNSDTPATLLKKVHDMLEQEGLSRETTYALRKLHTILQERAEYQSAIQYISWLIQQKRAVIRHLQIERKKSNQAKFKITTNKNNLHIEIRTVNKCLKAQCCLIRNLWAEPLADIAINWCSVCEELNQNYSDINDIFSEINGMIESHSHDEYRWDTLQETRNSLSRNTQILKGEKSQLYLDRQQWYSIRQAVLDLYKKYNIFLEHVDSNPDEVRILGRKKMDEMHAKQDSNNRFKEIIASLSAEQSFEEEPILLRIKNQKQTFASKQRQLSDAGNRIDELRKRDGPFSSLFLYWESDDVKQEKERKARLEIELATAKRQLETSYDQLNAVRAAYDNKIRSLKFTHQEEINSIDTRIDSIDHTVEYLQKKRQE